MRFVTLHTSPVLPPASYPLRFLPLHYTKKLEGVEWGSGPEGETPTLATGGMEEGD